MTVIVDAVHTGLRSGRTWPVGEPGRHVRAAAVPTAGFAELRRLLDAGAAPLERAAEASRAIARWSAVMATSLTEFARYRPAGQFDRQHGERGAMSAATRAARPAALTDVSEWAVDEVAPTRRHQRSGGHGPTQRLDRAHRAALDLLARGRLSPAHARQMVTIVGPVADDAVRADIEGHVLRLLGDKTPPPLGDCARRIVLRKDAEAAGRKLVAAIRERGVRLHDRRNGTGTLIVDLPLPTAAAVYRHLEAYADQTRVEGDERTKQQRMADCLTDLVLRAGQHGMPPVTIALTLVATLETMLGGNEPGQVDGHLVPAEMVRELGYAFGLMPRPAARLDDLAALGAEPPPREDPPPRLDTAVPTPAESAHAEAGEPPGAVGTPPTPVRDRPLAEWLSWVAARHDAAVRVGLGSARQAILDGGWTDGELRSVLDLGELIGVRDVRGTGLAHRPDIAVVDQLRGSLVALTDATGIRRGEALGPPAATDEHDPGAELDRFVRLRDRRCRFPGCRARARACDLDHRREWPDGPTAHHDLCCLCEHHHRLKHQAPGWRFDEADDGALAVTMPNGALLVSSPPRFGTDLDVPPF
ncbi:hypothetical protein ACI782_07395 [Geodermatophilus sp. SYSU D00703]